MMAMSTAMADSGTGSMAAPFVGREAELARLNSFLARALVGEGSSVCFVAGEAGQGKTSLLREFTRRLEVADSGLIVAVGDCNAQTGIGDPYLPFREILDLLTGDVEPRLERGVISGTGASRLTEFVRVSGRAVVESGPDLIGTFVPGGAFVARVAASLGRRVPWLAALEGRVAGPSVPAPDGTGREQSRIYEQYTNVLKRMAAEQPLLLVVDDLQWADAASIGLLFHLSRRLGSSRVLLVGAYRPDEVAVGRQSQQHPLEPVLQDLQRYFGDVTIDLSATGAEEGRRIVDGLVDLEPNRLGSAFRDALLGRTEGHPLFTVELLRSLRDTRALARDEEGRWIEESPMDWDRLPARVEGVIAGQVGRLEPDLAAALRVAAVEGETFTAEVVAGVHGVEPRDLVRQLSGTVEKRHRLVRAQETRLLDGRRVSRYRFRHNLFQRFLYQSLDPIERAYLHEGVARELEEMYGARADEVAVALAHHFGEAGHQEKAVDYLLRAGAHSAAVFANEEAVAHFRRALELVGTDRPDRSAELHERLAAVLELTGRHEPARAELNRALDLVPAHHRISRARLLAHRAKTYQPEQKFEESLADYARALQELGGERPPEDRAWWDAWLEANTGQIWALYLLNRPDDLEQLAARIAPVIDRVGNIRHRFGLVQTFLMVDYRRDRYTISDRALARARELVLVAEDMDHPTAFASGVMGVSAARFHLAFCHLWRRELEQAAEQALAALADVERSGDTWLQTLCLTYLGVVERFRSDVEGARHYARRAREVASSAGMPFYAASANANLAWAALRAGRNDEAAELASSANGTWDALTVSNPFRWMALWPLARIAQLDDAPHSAEPYLRRMLEPDQQSLPDPLNTEMIHAVQAWDRNDPVAAAEALTRAANLARAFGYA
jgi:tetratricopeptide (TPR) repeat protein